MKKFFKKVFGAAALLIAFVTVVVIIGIASFSAAAFVQALGRL